MASTPTATACCPVLTGSATSAIRDNSCKPGVPLTAPAHTHGHTRARVYTRTRTARRTHARTHAHANTRTYSRARAHLHTHPCARAPVLFVLHHALPANTEGNKKKWDDLQAYCDEVGDQVVTLDEWGLAFVKDATSNAGLDDLIQNAARSSKFVAEFVDKVLVRLNAYICERVPVLARDYQPPDAAEPPPIFEFLFNRR